MRGRKHSIGAFPFGDWSFSVAGERGGSIDEGWLREWSVSVPDARVAMIAAEQRGRITARQLRAARLSEMAVRRRAATGRLHRVHQGVYAVGHLGPVRGGDEAAALLACGPGAVLSHRTAAATWRLTPDAPGEPIGHDELTPRPGMPGAHRLRAATTENAGITHSDAERRLRTLLRRAGLPLPETNVRLAGHTVDAVWRGPRVVVEVDGFAAHGHRRAFESDRRRDLDLRDAGWIVARFTPRQLTGEPERVVAHPARLLARADAG